MYLSSTKDYRRYLFPFYGSYLLVLILFNPLLFFGQSDFEQMEQRVTAMPDDTAKVNRLLILGKHYCSEDNDKALMYLQEAYTISMALDYTSGIGKSLLWQGRVYYYKDNYSLSDKYLDKAKTVLEKIKDKNDLAFYYYAKGVNCNIRGDYIHALEMFKTSINIAEESGNIKWLSTCYSSIGSVLLNRQEPRKALGYFREALKMKSKINSKLGVSSVYTNIGIAYEHLRELDSAFYFVDKGLKIREQLKSERLIASSKYHLSNILIKKGNYAKAEKVIKDALDIFTKLKDNTGIIITSLRLAVAENKQGKSGAIVRAENALSLAKKIGNPNLTSHAYHILADIYAFNNKFQDSYNYLLKYEQLKDSLFTSEKERVLTEMEAKFQSDKKDRDIALLKERSTVERNKNIALIVLLFVFLIIIFLLFFMFRYKSTAFKRQEKLLEQEKIIHSQENMINEKENQLLQEQLESKNRELASKALEMIRYNDTVSGAIERLERMNTLLKDNPDALKAINDIIRDIDSRTRQNIWEEFEKVFKNIHSGFYKRLLEVCPDISSSEIKVAALLKLNLTTKEIAAITYKSEGGIKTTRYRLRKKLNLSSDEKLIPYLMQL